MTRGPNSMVVVYVFRLRENSPEFLSAAPPALIGFTWTTIPADFCGPASDERSRRLYKRLSTADRPDRI
jgi:hypothetical protein